VKSFGCNAIRTSHNPPSPELLELCDQMGFLVMDEAFDEWKVNHKKYGYGASFDQWSDPDLTSMIDRDRNHPCIILYSIGNEIHEGHQGQAVAGPMAKRLVAICHREDPTRPTTSACARPAGVWKSGLASELDVFGVNYSPAFYDTNDPAKAPGTVKPGDYDGRLPMFASETSSQVDTRDEYGLKLDPQGNVQVDPGPNFQVSSYDTWHPGWTSTGETDLLDLKNHPWIAGEFVWTGFDYLGEPTPYAWPSRSSYFGIVDTCGFPKDRYYIYKSVWNPEPMVHILPMSWTWPGFEGKTIPVYVFTNADSVELFLNGQSLGVKNFPTDCAQQQTTRGGKKITDAGVTSQLPGLRLAWNVAYAPGTLKAVARKNGEVVATDEIQTAGAPAMIKLEADRSKIADDGEDLSYIKVSILDKDGIVCPNADNEIKFTLSGPAASIAGLDNGDATNHEPFQGTQHKAFHGLGLVVLKSTYDKAGSVTLTASIAGLPDATTIVDVVSP
jgi:beta-galactosidase